MAKLESAVASATTAAAGKASKAEAKAAEAKAKAVEVKMKKEIDQAEAKNKVMVVKIHHLMVQAAVVAMFFFIEAEGTSIESLPCCRGQCQRGIC